MPFKGYPIWGLPGCPHFVAFRLFDIGRQENWWKAIASSPTSPRRDVSLRFWATVKGKQRRNSDSEILRNKRTRLKFLSCAIYSLFFLKLFWGVAPSIQTPPPLDPNTKNVYGGPAAVPIFCFEAKNRLGKHTWRNRFGVLVFFWSCHLSKKSCWNAGKTAVLNPPKVSTKRLRNDEKGGGLRHL